MKRVVPDASVLAALIFGEPGADRMVMRLKGAELWAPTLLQFELANVAWKKMRRSPEQGVAILAALRAFLADNTIEWAEIDVTDVILIAQQSGLTPYDASYVWLAGSLGAELVTLDKRVLGAVFD